MHRTPLKVPSYILNSCFGFPGFPKNTEVARLGVPLRRRIATLTNEFRCAIKNSQIQTLSLSFSARCCVKITQTTSAGLFRETSYSPQKQPDLSNAYKVKIVNITKMLRKFNRLNTA